MTLAVGMNDGVAHPRLPPAMPITATQGQSGYDLNDEIRRRMETLQGRVMELSFDVPPSAEAQGILSKMGAWSAEQGLKKEARKQEKTHQKDQKRLDKQERKHEKRQQKSDRKKEKRASKHHKHRRDSSSSNSTTASSTSSSSSGFDKRVAKMSKSEKKTQKNFDKVRWIVILKETEAQRVAREHDIPDDVNE